MKQLFAIAGLFIVAASSWGQNVEEVVVTGARTEEGAAMPGTFLRKTGDYLLLQVNVTNDTREAQARKDEIYATLRTALAAANKDGSIELSIIDEDDLVIDRLARRGLQNRGDRHRSPGALGTHGIARACVVRAI